MKKIFLPLLFILFSFAFNAKAVSYEQPNEKGYFFEELSGTYKGYFNDGTSTQISGDHFPSFSATSSLGTFATITEVSVLMSVGDFSYYGLTTFIPEAFIYCSDANGYRTTTVNGDYTFTVADNQFHQVNFNTSLVCDSATLNQLYIHPSNVYSPVQMQLHIQGINYNLTSGIGVSVSSNPGSSFSDNYEWKIAINGNFSPPYTPLSFNYPPTNSTSIAPNGSIIASGNCPTPLNALKLSPIPTWNVPKNSNGDLEWTDDNGNVLYDSTCGLDYTWSASTTPSLGWQTLYLMDESYLNNATTSIASTTFQIVQDIRELNNYITILYPRDDTGHYYFTVQPSLVFPVKFQYSNFKDYLAPTSTNATYQIAFFECTSLSYVDCSNSTTTLLSVLDPDNLGVFTKTFESSTTSPKYYQLVLLSSEDSYSTSKFVLNFTLNGDSSSQQSTTVPGNRCTNFLCDLFIPRSDFIKARMDSLKNGFYYRKPFSYLSYFTALITSYSQNLTVCSNGNHNYLLDTQYSFGGYDIPMQGLDTCEDNFLTIWGYIKPAIRYSMYLALLMYFIRRALTIFRRPTA